MDLATVRHGFLTDGLPERVVDEMVDAYVEAKRRYHLGDHRPNAVEGGRFSEAVFRLLQHATTGSFTPLGKTLPTIDKLLEKLANLPTADAPESVRIHIPRTLRLIYDIRNKRDTAHLGDGIDPNVQDATLVIGNMDWVMAELVRLHHGVSANEAQRIVIDLVTKEVPAIQEIDEHPVILKDLAPRDQALLLLYRAGTAKGAAIEELVGWLRINRRDHLLARLRRLDAQGLIFEHPKSGLFHITDRGIRDVEQRRLAQLNRPGKVGGSVPWKRGWSHGTREVTGEADHASVYA